MLFDPIEKWKLQLICPYCSKIFKDPILLPCDDSICREHLSEEDVFSQNRIKCNECKQEYQVQGNNFKSSKAYKKLIESHSYLSEEEIRLKQKLEGSIQKFFQFYDEFIQKKMKTESDVYDHFQEMRFQIDEHKEELKNKIDEIALEMIDETKKHEALYLNSLKEKFFGTQSFDDTKSLEDELTEMEETFRNPNLLIKTIKEMQRKQKKNINVIQLKLNEMAIVKDNLKGTNYFQPNLSSLNQKEEASLFGLIHLNQFSNVNSFKSQILEGEKQLVEMINLCEFSPNDKFTLLYRGSRDGFGSNDFHSKCDGHANTLTILKAKQTSFIFGGFTTVGWDSSSGDKSDPNAFIFSLTDNTPLKMKIDPKSHQYAIRCDSRYGPTFGCGSDIHIANNANTTMNSYSNLGITYRHPQYAYGTNEAKTFLAGSNRFQLDEIEVYQKE
jgi:hypothetical protein